jgi:hypothetical protein
VRIYTKAAVVDSDRLIAVMDVTLMIYKVVIF